MDDKYKYQSQGLNWLYEMELLNHPQLINNLKLNILTVSNSINDVELLMSRPHKQILIYIELGWFARKFKFRTIEADILDIMGQLLPTYTFRVVCDKTILNLAITKLENSLKGVSNEVSNNGNIDESDDDTSQNELSEPSDILPNQEEQAEDDQSESDEIIKSDIQSVQDS